MFRQLELLHLWCLYTFENAPKSAPIQEDVKLLIENVVNAQSAVAMALTTTSPTQRLDFLDMVVMCMANIKSITKVLTEYSSVSKSRVISKSSRVRLLELMTQIGCELGSWRNKTAGKISKSVASAPN